MRPIAQDLISGQNNQHPGLIIGTDIDDPDVYRIKSIIGFQIQHKWQKFKYIVKWKEWPHKYNTKKPVAHLEGF